MSVGRWRVWLGLVLAAAVLPAASAAQQEGAPVALPLPAGEPEAASAVLPASAEAAPGVSDGFRNEIERAWFRTEGGPGARANGARVRAIQLGADNVESAARALIAPGGEPATLGEAMLAVRLAPDLPMAHMALARVAWRDGERTAALRSVADGLRAIPRHHEASIWLASSVLVMFSAVLIGGTLLFIGLVGASVFSRASHDLGDLFSKQMPDFSRAALLGSLLLAPILLGEGLAGLAVALFVLGMAYGGARHRVALTAAVALLLLGLYPVARVAGSALAMMGADPVAEAALMVARGTESPLEVSLLERASVEDPLAEHALALHARRSGDSELAYQRYTALLADEPRDAVLLTNLGNLHFERSEFVQAIDYYERASGVTDAPTLLFDLSQAYARSFRMEEFETALRRAQSLGSGMVEELSQQDDPSLVADLPLPTAQLRDRMLAAASGDAFARDLRAPIAKGRLAQGWQQLGGAFAAAGVLGILLAGRFDHASGCRRCGRRICGRCDGTMWSSDVCEACHRLFNQPQSTDASLRMARLSDLRKREARISRASNLISFLVPGMGGILAERPDLGLVGVLLFGWAAASFVWRAGVVPDPLAVGAAGPLVFLITAALALLGYLLVSGSAILTRRSL